MRCRRIRWKDHANVYHRASAATALAQQAARVIDEPQDNAWRIEWRTDFGQR